MIRNGSGTHAPDLSAWLQSGGRHIALLAALSILGPTPAIAQSATDLSGIVCHAGDRLCAPAISFPRLRWPPAPSGEIVITYRYHRSLAFPANDGASAVYDGIEEAIAEWNDALLPMGIRFQFDNGIADFNECPVDGFGLLFRYGVEQNLGTTTCSDVTKPTTGFVACNEFPFFFEKSVIYGYTQTPAFALTTIDGTQAAIPDATKDGAPLRWAMIEINDKVPWGGGGYNAVNVALHEIGHVLGLGHTIKTDAVTKRESIMVQGNACGDPVFGISTGDVRSVACLYDRGTDEVGCLKKTSLALFVRNHGIRFVPFFCPCATRDAPRAAAGPVEYEFDMSTSGEAGPWRSLARVDASAIGDGYVHEFASSTLGAIFRLVVLEDGQPVDAALAFPGVPEESAGMVVKPDSAIGMSVVSGGAPVCTAFSVRNARDVPLSWTAIADKGWLQANPAAGFLSPGDSTVVNVCMSSAGLPAGSYKGSISFAADSLTVARQVSLDVTACPPRIELGPGAVADTLSTGRRDTVEVVVSNTASSTCESLKARLAISPGSALWASVAPETLDVTGGTSGQVRVVVDADSLVAGDYVASLIVNSNDPGQPSLVLPLHVTVQIEPLVLTPADSLFSSGNQGGPFAPRCKNYVLSNSGAGPVMWAAASHAAWLGISPSSGTLLPGVSTPITACVTATADSLAPNVYTTAFEITNLATGDGALRYARLAVLDTCPDVDGDGWSRCAGDCNDSDPSVHPGAPELCDGKDNDCDGTVDNGPFACGLTGDTLITKPFAIVPNARGIAFSRGGAYGRYMYVLTTTRDIYRVDSVGVATLFGHTRPNARANPSRLFFDDTPDRRFGGYLYATIDNGPGSEPTSGGVDRILPDGTPVIFADAPGSPPLNGMCDGDIDDVGRFNHDMFVSDFEADDNGSPATVIRLTPGAARSPLGTASLRGALGIELDRLGKFGGDLIVANAHAISSDPWWNGADNKIYRVGPDGSRTPIVGDRGLGWPFDIGVDALGRFNGGGLFVSYSIGALGGEHLVLYDSTGTERARTTGSFGGVEQDRWGAFGHDTFVAEVTCNGVEIRRVEYATKGCPDLDGDGWSSCAGDCDDQDPSVHPNALEVCDGKDNDCNGSIDDTRFACNDLANSDSLVTEVFGDSIPTPFAIAFSPGGPYGDFMYVATSSEIWRVAPSGKAERFATERTVGGASIQDLYFDTTPDHSYCGSLFMVLDYFGGACYGGIDRILPDGTVVPFVNGCTGSPPLLGSAGMVIDDLGRFGHSMFLADFEADEFGRSPSTLIRILPDGSRQPFDSVLLRGIAGVDLDRLGKFGGDLLATNTANREWRQGDNALYRVAPDGARSVVVPDAGKGLPSDVLADGLGRLGGNALVLYSEASELDEFDPLGQVHHRVVMPGGATEIQDRLAQDRYGHFGFDFFCSAPGLNQILRIHRFQPPNSAPVAVDDAVTAVEDVRLAIGSSRLLLNDSDADHDTLSIIGVVAVSDGVVSLVDTVITFTAPTNSDCDAAFDYVVRDPGGAMDTARVVVHVLPANDAPLAEADFVETSKNTALAIDACTLLANDADPDSACRLPGVCTAGPPMTTGLCLGTCDTLTLVSVRTTGNSHGTVELRGQSVFFTPANDFAGQASFIYTVSDGHGGQADGNVFVTVTPSFTMPDLLVRDVSTTQLNEDCSTLHATGVAAATVSNRGEAPVSSPFSVRFFEDRNRNGAFEPGVDAELGIATVSSPMAIGQDVSVSVPVDAFLSFAGSPVCAICDADNVIPELDESNNLGNSGQACRFAPSPGGFDPVVEWHWAQSTIQPDALNVMSTPGVMDLDGDGTPEVVFGSTASRGGGFVEVGYLRALHGRDGSEYFTVTDPSHLVNTASSVAIANIDADPSPEIIACHSSGNRLIAFENDGTFKWLSPPLEAINWGAPSIADLDHDGTPEIVIGRQVLNADGSLRWTGTGGRAVGRAGPLSIVADINLDGSPDVIAGNTAYRANGTVLWTAPCPDGYDAVGNFDGDPFPEVVVVGSGNLYLLEHDGTIKWGPIPIPGGGTGGAPTIADFDGDGQPEIGVAGATRYCVFEGTGALRWASTTQDGTSNVTGSSVFDFDGDGSAEVVYRDELKLRIYRGSDGVVLFEVPMSSCTWYEYVLVADVDGDGKSELVAVANDNCGFGPQRGVYVFGDRNNSWVPCRKVWNEFSYHITNINDDGSVPAFERNSWLYPGIAPYNSYRQNILTTASPLAAADLTASAVHVSRFGCSDTIAMTARIGNAGSSIAPSPVKVALYDGDPGAAGKLLGVVATTSGLEPGGYQDVSGTFGSASVGPHTFWARVDDDGSGVGGVRECDEGNNTCSVSVTIDSKPSCSLAAPSAVPACGSSGNRLCVTNVAGTGLSYAWRLISASGAWMIEGGQGTDCIAYRAGPPGDSVTARVILSTATGCMDSCEVRLGCSSPPLACNRPRGEEFWEKQCGDEHDDDLIANARFDRDDRHKHRIPADSLARLLACVSHSSRAFGPGGCFAPTREMLTHKEQGARNELAEKYLILLLNRCAGLLCDSVAIHCPSKDEDDDDDHRGDGHRHRSDTTYVDVQTVGRLIAVIDTSLCSHRRTDKIQQRLARLADCVLKSGDQGDDSDGDDDSGTAPPVALDGPGEAPRVFSIVGVSPSPSTGKLAVRFTAPTPGTVRYEILDIAGRRVSFQEISVASPGEVTVASGNIDLPAGVYVLRLTLAGRSLNRRVVIVR